MAQTTPAAADPAPPPQGSFAPSGIDPGPGRNALIAITPESVFEAAERASQEERAVLLERLRRDLPDFATQVQLASPEAEAILELLLERTLIERSTSLTVREFVFSRPMIDDLLQRLSRIEALLGTRVGLYRTYVATLAVRRRVGAFDAELADEDRLSVEQKELLITALSQLEQLQPPARTNWFAVLPTSEADAALAAKRFDVEREQYGFLRRRDLTRQQLQRAAEVLTARQFDVFLHIQSERLEFERTQVEDLRLAAGLERVIPE